jgi:hypothetical protein
MSGSSNSELYAEVALRTAAEGSERKFQNGCLQVEAGETSP